TQQRYAEAEKILQDSISLYQHHLPINNSFIAIAMDNLAQLYSKQNRLAEAKSYHLAALNIRKKLLPSNQLDIAYSLNNIGGLYLTQHDYENARIQFEEALKISRKQLHLHHPNIALLLNNLGRVYEMLGRIADAKRSFTEAIDISMIALEKNHPTTKLYIENFNNFSSNRAIWELVQNACDLTDNCEIVIDYSKSGLSFTHNGKPFSTKALISLVKQVSGKYGEETDLPEVGKYGTGFLTTHTFGRKFSIDSILEANGISFEIEDFLVDRSPKEWRELSGKIKIQKDNVYKLIKEGVIIENPVNRTIFTYIPETGQELAYTSESSKDLEDYLPIVLTINDRLKKAIIISQSGVETSFERTDKQPVPNEHNINLFKTSISKNGIEKTVYSIVD
ncbi:MAG: tetratricopeptide repeat protein, partial [Sphingobacteriales bacterium]